MRFIFMAMLFSVIGCKNPKTNSFPRTDTKLDGKSNSKPTDLIPLNVKNYIKNNLPGWVIPDTSDYSKSWWSFYERSQIPYFVTTDLNDDQVADYAFILKSQNAIRLVILIGSGDTFIPWLANDLKETFKGKDVKFGLTIEPPARIDCVVNNIESSHMLTSNSIALMELEQKSKIFYWNKGTIKAFGINNVKLPN